MSTSGDPREVLGAVRRLEEEIDALRARARAEGAAAPPPGDDLADRMAAGHRELVEDLERVVELIGASWRSTRDQLTQIQAEVAELRQAADHARGALQNARLEVRLGGFGNGTAGAGLTVPDTH